MRVVNVDNRAYTYIDRGRAVAGNRWMERVWSAFLGNTVSLVQKEPGFEWIVGQSAEFRLALEDNLLDVLDFGEVDWSEESSPIGASLVCRQRHGRFEMVIRTLVYHDLPVMVRAVNVTNLGPGRVRIDHLLSDRLPLRHPGVRVYTHDFAQSHGPTVWETHEHAAAIAVDDVGLFFGRRGGGLFFLFAPEAQECAVTVPGPLELASGETWHTSPTFLLPYSGLTRDAAATVYSQFLTRFLSGQD